MPRASTPTPVLATAVAATLACAGAPAAAPLGAQGVTLAPFAAVNHGLQPAPRMVGLSTTLWAGAAGLRGGAAMDLPSSPIAPAFGHPPAEATGAWSGEVDLVLSGARAGITLGGVRPSLFTGFGVHGRRRLDGSTATIPAWSYGAGAAVPLASRLTIETEARYRMPHESDRDRLPPDVGGGWEYRAGLALHLGAGARRRARTPGPAVPRTIHIGRAGSSAPPAGPSSGRSASAAAIARGTLDTADRYVGVRYVWGGSSPAEGFDCSGFVQYVFGRNGVRLPRVSRDQARAGRPLPASVAALQPGDLMFYAGADGVVNHVAIYAGDNRIIHSSASGRGVRYDDLGTRRGRYYATRMVAARRVIPDATPFAPFLAPFRDAGLR